LWALKDYSMLSQEDELFVNRAMQQDKIDAVEKWNVFSGAIGVTGISPSMDVPTLSEKLFSEVFRAFQGTYG
jgi:hypothetical protein